MQPPRICWLLWLLPLLLTGACKPMEEPDIPPAPTQGGEPGISLPNAEGLLAVDLTSGFRTAQMKLSENVSWTYSIYVPEELDESTPLVLALHGGSGNQNSSRDFMLCLPFPALQQLNAIIFAPTGGQWWEEVHSQRVLEFVKLAKLHWPIDSNKVAVTGYSNGGTGSVYFSKLDNSPFSAAIPMGADYQDEICPGIPTYLIHGQEDEFYPSIDLQRTVDKLTAESCDIQLHLVANASHGAACQMISELAIAGAWLELEVWKE